MQVIPVADAARGFGATSRRDNWWVAPLFVFLGLGGFLVYGTWAAMQGAYFEYGPYLSPFYAPVLWGDSPHAWFGTTPPAWVWPSWLGAIVPYSPALLILPFPGLFRFTCYYYRGAYYKAFWADPPSCAVGEPRKSYWGEASFPLILQNIHRYILYIAVVFIFLLAYDAWLAMWWTDAVTGEVSFGIGVGTLLLCLNVTLIAAYTFGCHAMRHIVGGFRDEVSKSKLSHACYNCSSALNYKHQLFAWCSLFSVAFSDIYIRLCAMGIWTDLRIL
jgi:hypothetical protein